ncbi:MAG: GntR family transcriptional regulator [Cryobacterium sp.]
MEDRRDEERAAFRRAAAMRILGEPKQNEVRRVYALMRTAIRSQVVQNGEMLVEATVMRQFNTTRQAVRGALSQLADDGLVERLPRIGTKVRDSFDGVEIGLPLDASERYDVGLPDGALDRYDIAPIYAEVVPGSPVIRAQLELGPESAVSMAEYLISSAGVPFCVETCYWAPDVTPRVPFVAEPGDDLPKSFERHFGLPLLRSSTSVEALQGDANTCAALGLAPASPLLISERVLYDTNDVPRELQYIYYAASRTYFRANTSYR